MVKSPIQQTEETAFNDHTVIVPPHRLHSVIKHTPEPGDFAMDVVARAESALAEIKHEFRDWMGAECKALEAARNELAKNGPSKPAIRKVFDAAHEVKGQAAVLGFPLAGRIAAILCRLLNHAPNAQLVPLILIEKHVDAIEAVVREEIHTTEDATGREIFERLARIVEDFLSHALGDAYNEIAADAPKLSPPAKAPAKP